MKFSWVALAPGAPAAPWIKCRFRRAATPIPFDIMMLLDTGADTTVLPMDLAAPFGFDASHFEEIDMNAVGGLAKTKRVKGDCGTEIDIGGFWVKLPCLTFVEKTAPLLGRDIIFSNFDIRMTLGETDLRPKK